MSSRVYAWISKVQQEAEWYPGKEPSVEELVVNYIVRLQEENRKLREFQTNEMWRRDQESNHRMGL